MAIDDQEFADFFAARFDWARRISHAMCGDWSEAEELAQAAFVRLYARWRTVRIETVDAYLRTILTRLFLDTRRRSRGREQTFATVPEQAVPPDDSADRIAVRAALLTVPPGQRAVLVLRFVADLSVDQVAEALGLSPGTVKSQTARGLATLRKAHHLIDLTLTRTS